MLLCILYWLSLSNWPTRREGRGRGEGERGEGERRRGGEERERSSYLFMAEKINTSTIHQDAVYSCTCTRLYMYMYIYVHVYSMDKLYVYVCVVSSTICCICTDNELYTCLHTYCKRI